jgi:hypothetical protein
MVAWEGLSQLPKSLGHQSTVSTNGHLIMKWWWDIGYGFQPYQATLHCHSWISLALTLLLTAQTETRYSQIDGYPLSSLCFPSVVYQSDHWSLLWWHSLLWSSDVRLPCCKLTRLPRLKQHHSTSMIKAWEVAVVREAGCVSIFSAPYHAYGYLTISTQGMTWDTRRTRWYTPIQTSMQDHSLTLIPLTCWW